MSARELGRKKQFREFKNIAPNFTNPKPFPNGIFTRFQSELFSLVNTLITKFKIFLHNIIHKFNFKPN